MIKIKYDKSGMYPWENNNKKLLEKGQFPKKQQERIEKPLGVQVTISNEGRKKLASGEMREDVECYEIKYAKSNEVCFEHYMDMHGKRYDILKKISKEREYNLEDVMVATVEALEAHYNELIEQHKSGERLVRYGFSGDRSLSLEEDLEGFNEACDECFDAVQITIMIEDQNKHNPLSDMSWWAIRMGMKWTPHEEVDEAHRAKVRKYTADMMDIMKQTKTAIMENYAKFGYRKGMAAGILTQMLGEWKAENKELEDELWGEK